MQIQMSNLSSTQVVKEKDMAISKKDATPFQEYLTDVMDEGKEKIEIEDENQDTEDESTETKDEVDEEAMLQQLLTICTLPKTQHVEIQLEVGSEDNLSVDDMMISTFELNENVQLEEMEFVVNDTNVKVAELIPNRIVDFAFETEVVVHEDVLHQEVLAPESSFEDLMTLKTTSFSLNEELNLNLEMENENNESTLNFEKSGQDVLSQPLAMFRTADFTTVIDSTMNENLSLPTSRLMNQDEVLTTIEQQMKLVKENETKTLSLALYPQKLGVINVELKLKNGVLYADIRVENVEAKAEIEQALQKLNLEMLPGNEVRADVNAQSQRNKQQNIEGLELMDLSRDNDLVEDVPQSVSHLNQPMRLGQINLKI